MKPSSSYRIPNLVIGSRVILAFAVVVLLSTTAPAWVLAGVALVPLILALDAVDGIVARALGRASKLGAVLDITADRIVEHVFWIFFAVAGVVGIWAPLLVTTRSFVVDSIRSLALSGGRTPFGEQTMMRSPITRFLTGSRWMRNLYGLAKAVAFVLLAALVARHQLDAGAHSGLAILDGSWLQVAAQASAVLAVALCLARGIPVVWDSGPYLTRVDDPEGAS